jgi:hypothetical protein
VVAGATPLDRGCLRKKRKRQESVVRKNKNADRRLLQLESEERRRSVVLRQVANSLKLTLFPNAVSDYSDRKELRITYLWRKSSLRIRKD